tara:strand:- start:60630 stop:60950 length:321 start_codon:yes stop_codon:yes gene_type:complete
MATANFIARAGNISALDLRDIEHLEGQGIRFGVHEREWHATCDVVSAGLSWTEIQKGDGVTKRTIWMCVTNSGSRLFWASKFGDLDAAFDHKLNDSDVVSSVGRWV